MGLVAKRMADKRLLRLLRGFLTAGELTGGGWFGHQGDAAGRPLWDLGLSLILDADHSGVCPGGLGAAVR